MPRKCEGFILLVVLIYMQLLALLVLSGLAGALSIEKLIKWKVMHFNYRQKALWSLNKLDREIQKNCDKPIYPPVFLRRQPMSFWWQNACLGSNEFGRYYYLVGVLELDLCAEINVGDGQGKAVIFYRQTLLLGDKGNVVVQDTIALPSHTPPRCIGEIRQVRQGRQSLRWIR